MGLRKEMQNWFDIVELSKGFREAGQNLGEQDRAAKLRELAARAPEMMAQPGGAERFAAESAVYGAPEMLRQVVLNRAGYEQEMGQGLSPAQMIALGFDQETASAFDKTSLPKQKLAFEQRNKKEEMDFEKSLYYAKQAAKRLSDDKDSERFKANEAEAAGFFLEMNDASKQIEEALMRSPDLVSRFSTKQLLEYINAPESIKDENLKKYAVAVRSYINAKTRKRSGAAITENEFDLEGKPDIPAGGDTPDVLLVKRDNRTKNLAGLKTEAGPGAISVANRHYNEIKKETEGIAKKNRYEGLKKRISTIKNKEDREEAMLTLKSYGDDIPDDFVRLVNEASVGR